MTYINAFIGTDPIMAIAGAGLVLIATLFTIGVYFECRRSSEQQAHQKALDEDVERRRKESWKLNRESNWVD